MSFLSNNIIINTIIYNYQVIQKKTVKQKFQNAKEIQYIYTKKSCI
jgi:hypothetical protein